MVTEDGCGKLLFEGVGQHPKVVNGVRVVRTSDSRPSPSQVRLNSGGVLVEFFLADSGGPRSMSMLKKWKVKTPQHI